MRHAFVFAVLSITLALPVFAQDLSSQQKEVWQLEESYWTDVKDFNEAHYLKLWHDNFLGWPRDQPAPIGKKELAEAVHSKFARKGAIDYEFLSKAVRVTNGVGITQYSVKSSFTGADGKKETFTSRITHTWIKTEEGWRIVGGMSALSESNGHTW
jgi:ketosteroid isomerase-like protein